MVAGGLQAAGWVVSGDRLLRHGEEREHHVPEESVQPTGTIYRGQHTPRG